MGKIALVAPTLVPAARCTDDRSLTGQLWDLDTQVQHNIQWPLLLTWFNFNPSMDK